MAELADTSSLPSGRSLPNKTLPCGCSEPQRGGRRLSGLRSHLGEKQTDLVPTKGAMITSQGLCPEGPGEAVVVPSAFSVQVSQHASISAMCHSQDPGDGAGKTMAIRDSSASLALVHSSYCQEPHAPLPMPCGWTASEVAMKSLEGRCGRPKTLVLGIGLEDSTSIFCSLGFTARPRCCESLLSASPPPRPPNLGRNCVQDGHAGLSAGAWGWTRKRRT